MTVFSILTAIGAVALLHFSWQQPVRSIRLNALGWLLLLAALAMGASDTGAWGLTLVSIGATSAALGLLGWAALRSPPDKAKASTRRVNMLPEPGEPKQMGRRIVTFLLTVPAAFIVVLLVGVAARGVAILAGWTEADSNVLTLFLVPFLWGVLMAVLLLETRRSRQLMMLALPALASGGFLVTGAAL